MSADLFVTQLDTTEPIVLVISDSSPLTSLVQRISSEMGLTTTLVSTVQLPLLRNQVLQFYKIIWVVSDPAQQLASTQQTVEWLLGRSEPISVLVSVVTGVREVSAEFDRWLVQSQTQNTFLSYLSTYVPQATLFLIYDWVPETRAVQSVVDFLCDQLDQGHLLNPACPLLLQESQTLNPILKQALFNPQLTGTIAIHGQVVHSDQTVKTIKFLYFQYYGVELRVKATEASIESTWPSSFLLQSATPDLTTLLVPFVRNLPVVNPPPFSDHSSSPQRTTYVSEVVSPVIRLSLEDEPSDKNMPGKPPWLMESIITAAQSKVIAPPKKTAQPQRPATAETAPKLESSTPPVPVVKPKQPDLPDEKQLDQAVLDLFEEKRSEVKVTQVKNIIHDTIKVTHKLKRKKRLYVSSFLIVALVLTVLSLGITYGVSQFLNKRAFASVIAGQPKQLSETRLKSTRLISSVLLKQTDTYGSWLSFPSLIDAAHLAKINMGIVEIQPSLESWKMKVATVAINTLSSQGNPSKERLKEVGIESGALYENLSVLQALLKDFDTNTVEQVEQDSLTTFISYLNQERRTLAVMQQIHPLLPTLLGFEGQRNYVILFQNQQELRPTGGFIQSVGLVTLSNGSVINSQVMSSYELDTKVPGQVKPPAEVETYLGEKQLYFRDSNWNPDFPSSAQQISWFVQQATGKENHGVIAINGHSLQQLLKAVGPIDLPEYNEVLTDRNIQERLEFHSEIQFTPGQSKQDYSTVLLSKVLKHITSLPPEKMTPLLSALNQSLIQQQMLIALTSPSEQTVMNNLSWSGSMITPQCPTQLSNAPCTVDTFAQIEANVGINKANYQIERSATHTIELSNSAATHTRTLVLNNRATSNAWPKGTYKSYIRFYITPDSELTDIKINGRSLPSNAITQRSEKDKKVIGVLTETPIQQQTTLELTYSRPLSPASQFSYAFFNQKQSGVESSNLKILLKHDSTLQPLVIAPQASVTGQTIQFSIDQLTHSFVGAQFK